MITTASGNDLLFITHLQKKFTDQLGFLPTQALEEYIARRTTTVVTQNGEPAGYMITRPTTGYAPTTASIIQAAVCFDAQRRSLGLALVNDTCESAKSNGSRIVQCWCAANIDAREFWQAAGFVEVARRSPHNSRNRELILYRRPLVTLRTGEIDVIPRHNGSRGSRLDTLGQLPLFAIG